MKKSLAILVCAYNSSHTISDTLNSLTGQPTGDVALIVSDDGSVDNTCGIVEDWMEKYGNQFLECKLIKSDRNTGVSNNAARGMKAVHADFVKIIAGDDIFTANSIADILEAVSNPANADCGILVGKAYQFTSDECVYDTGIRKIKCEYSRYPYEKELITFSTAKDTRERLKNLTTVGPGTVFNRKTYEELGGFDSKYPYFEDLPYFIKCMKNDVKFGYIDKYLVYYRKSSYALTNRVVKKKYMNERFFSDYNRFYWKELRPMYIRHRNYRMAYEGDLNNLRARLVIKFGHNEMGWVYRLTKPLMLLSPSALKEEIRKHIQKRVRKNSQGHGKTRGQF